MCPLPDDGPAAPTDTFSPEQAQLAIRLAKNSYNRSDLLGREFDATQNPPANSLVDLRLRYP